MKFVHTNSLSERGLKIVTAFRIASMQIHHARSEGSNFRATYNKSDEGQSHYLNIYRGAFDTAQKDFMDLYNGKHELTNGLPESTIKAYLAIADKKQVEDDFTEPAEFLTGSASRASNSISN